MLQLSQKNRIITSLLDRKASYNATSKKKMQFIELLSIINRKDTRQLHLNNYVESIKFIMLFFFVRFFF